jgi:hypothetical protein
MQIAFEMQDVVLEGLKSASLVEELQQRGCLALGLKTGVRVALRSGSRLLRVEQAFSEAGLNAGGALDVCVSEGGGMPESNDKEMIESLGVLLGQISQDIAGIEGAVSRQLSHDPGAGVPPAAGAAADTVAVVATRVSNKGSKDMIAVCLSYRQMIPPIHLLRPRLITPPPKLPTPTHAVPSSPSTPPHPAVRPCASPIPAPPPSLLLMLAVGANVGRVGAAAG